MCRLFPTAFVVLQTISFIYICTKVSSTFDSCTPTAHYRLINTTNYSTAFGMNSFSITAHKSHYKNRDPPATH